MYHAVFEVREPLLQAQYKSMSSCEIYRKTKSSGAVMPTQQYYTCTDWLYGTVVDQRCQETGNRQGRLSRHFHPSSRIIPIPGRKTPQYLCAYAGIFTPYPRIFPSRLSDKALALTASVNLASLLYHRPVSHTKKSRLLLFCFLPM